MFWGLVLEPGKRYSTTVEKSFHVSKAVLDCSSVRNEQEVLCVILETEGSESLLCNLSKQKSILQESLDLNFMSGDRLTFECRGHGRVHLSGYLLPDDDDMSGVMGEEDSEEEEEDDTVSGWSGTPTPEKSKKGKRKPDTSPPGVSSKKKKTIEENEEETDSDQEYESDDMDDDEDLGEEEEDEEMSDKDDDDDEEESMGSDEETVIFKQEAQQKQNKKTPNKQPTNTPKKTPVTNGVSPKEQKSNKKTPSAEKTPNTNAATPKQKQILEHGVVVKELKVGSGQPAKLGKMVSVHYVGRLKDSNKVFDKQTKGEGFKFKLGKGEVIKGWDVGVQGMKVGGKRIISCPPEAAYGAKGIHPKIPPNSTLVFEVELKNVHH